MTENNNFQEYIEVALSDDREQHVLIIKHSNIVFVNENSIDYDSVKKHGYTVVLHNYENCIQKPFEPFLDVIKSYVQNNQIDLDAFMDKNDVYALHKGSFKCYLNGEKCVREEDILLGEFKYEKERARNAVINMIREVAKKEKLFFVLTEINTADVFVWEIIRDIIGKKLRIDNVQFLITYNSLGKIFPYCRNRIGEILVECEENGAVFEWAYEGVGEKITKEEKERWIEDEIRDIYDDLIFLECEKVSYWLNNIIEQYEDNKIELNVVQKIKIYKASTLASLYMDNYSDALFACKKLDAIQIENPKKRAELRLWAELYRALIQVYNNEDIVAKKHIDKCEKIAKELDNEKYLFMIELLKNMVQYSGWKDLWISEHDAEVSKELIALCKKYNYFNHLAHIYIYSFNSDYTKYIEVEGIWERIPEFNYGIEIAYELGNECLIDAAYMKNVLLASIHGNFEVCIFFYMKLMENVEKGNDETMEADIYNGLGYSSCGLGRYVDSNKYYVNALKIFFKQKNGDKIIETLYNMGINAILAGANKMASEYLLVADFILKNLKQCTLNCCHISKFYTLLSLAYFNNGVYYQAHTYLNYAKAYLSHVLGKEDEREVSFSDDSMFLVYFLDALFAEMKGEYQVALVAMDSAEFYMRRSTGAMFFNFPQYALLKHKILVNMGDAEGAEQSINEAIKYCEESKFEYYLEKMKCAKNGVDCNLQNEITITGISLKDIETWVKNEYMIRKNMDLIETIDLLQSLQKNISQMSGTIEEELANLIPLFRKKFALDRAIFIKVINKVGKVEYTDLKTELSDENIQEIVAFFEKERREFILTDKSLVDEKYESILSKFSSNRILSFIAVPNFVDDELDAIMISYIEMSEEWLARRKNSTIEESDLNIFSYITKKICDAINRQELTEDLIEANKQMKIQMENAKRANEAKSRFLANMSHEIRTPINAIIGMNEMIMRESEDESVQGYASDVGSAAKSLLSIINDVLDMSKIESGKLEIFEVEYSLEPLINDLINMVSIKAKEKNLDFVLNVGTNLPTKLFGDDVRIKQIIINLLSNAVKYTKEGTVTLEILGEINGDCVDLTVKVKDTGIGIKQEDISKLFVAFERIEESRNRNIEGTGLGMNITNSLLTLMGSNLDVESEYGKGSVFSFVLKQKIIDGTPIGEISDKPKHMVDGTSHKSHLYMPHINMLVVDDNDMNRKVFINLLKKSGINIDQAESGFKCLEMTKNKKYDLIFLDHMMPEMDGIQTFHIIREDKSNACNEVPVVVLTANALVGAREQYLAEGFNDYLSKPIVPDKLEKMIKKMILGDENVEAEAPSDAKVDLSQIPEMDYEYSKVLLKDEALVQQTAIDFYKSLEKEIKLLAKRIQRIEDTEVLNQYRIQVHALKSSSKMIGILALSGVARLCELAAKDEDISRINVLTPILLEELIKTKENLSVLADDDENRELATDESELKEKLDEMIPMLEIFDLDGLDTLIAEIRKKRYQNDTETKLELLEENIRNVMLDDALETIKLIL